MYPSEIIPDGSVLFRLVPKSMINKRSLRPSENMFKPDSDGLSVDWNKYSSPHESLVRKGLEYKTGRTIFKNPADYLVFQMKVEEIKQLSNELSVLHTPVFRGEPPPIGAPNNRSHSSIQGYVENDEETRLKLRDIAMEVQGIDYEFVQNEVQEQRI